VVADLGGFHICWYMLPLIFASVVSCLFRYLPDPCAGSDGGVRW